MIFTEALTTLITGVIGAGVFALPTFARELGVLSILFIFLGFVFSLLLGYVILSFTPGSVDDEVGRVFGKKLSWAPLLLDIVISLLALTAYITGVQAHLRANPVILLFFMFIPLFFRLHFPASFSLGLAGMTVLFILILSFMNFSRLSSFPTSSLNLGFGGLLLAASYFAFFGHNLIPRVRAMLQKIKKVWVIMLISFSVALVLYSLFTLATIPMGLSDLSTVMLSEIYEGSTPSTIALIASLIFYTSFILIGLHIQDRIGRTSQASISIVAAVVGLYSLTLLLGIPFSVIIASAGFAVSCYGGLVGVTAIKRIKKANAKDRAIATALLVMSGLPWLLLTFGAIFG